MSVCEKKVLPFGRENLIERLEREIAEDGRKSIPVIKQVTVYNSDGDVISDSLRKPYKPNGSGFVISYTEKMCEFLEEVKTGSIVRLFVYIAHHQQYGSDGKTYGYRCSHKYLQKVLNVDKSTLWEAFKFLKENFLVNESKIDGQIEFMVNPNYVTIGTDKKTRMREWNRRWTEQLTKKNRA